LRPVFLHRKGAVVTMLFVFIVAAIICPKPGFLLVLGWIMIRRLRGNLTMAEIIDGLVVNLLAAYLYDLS
jgi:hypothetical protein